MIEMSENYLTTIIIINCIISYAIGLIVGYFIERGNNEENRINQDAGREIGQNQ